MFLHLQQRMISSKLGILIPYSHSVAFGFADSASGASADSTGTVAFGVVAFGDIDISLKGRSRWCAQ